MARKIRKDITVKGLEKKLEVGPGFFKNADGRDTRSDKKLETIQKEADAIKRKNAKKKTVFKKTVAKKTTTKKTVTVRKPKIKVELLVTADQKSAARRTVKASPKIPASLLKKVTAAVKKNQAK